MRLSLLTVGFIAVFAGTTVALGQVNLALNSPSNISQSAKRLNLNLQAEKQVIVKDETDKNQKPKILWEPLETKAPVQPSDLIRYTVRGESKVLKSVNNFVLTQPIPPATTYILNSATLPENPDNQIKIFYSIDGGKTFTPNPTIQVKLPDGTIETKPAPAELYTHLRWMFNQPVDPNNITASYQVKVK